MVEGALFYWFSWIFCIIVLFFMKKNKLRTYFSFWILTVIICSNQFVTIVHLNISMTFIIMYIGSFFIVSTLSRRGYHLFISFTIMIGYVGFQLLGMNAPIWFFGSRIFLISVIVIFLIVLLTKNFYSRFIVGLIGMCSGEVLYSLILVTYHIPKRIGDFVFLDTVLLTLFGLFILKQYDKVKSWSKVMVTKYS